MSNIINSISKFFTNVVHKFLPDPLIFAIILTMIVFVIGFTITPHTAEQMVMIWGDGFWNLLAFSMQMSLVLVTGHVLASSTPVRNGMKAVASIATTPTHGVMLVTFVSAIACTINWGFGLVLGAMFAREVARRIPKSDYSLLIACAYIGFLTWHGGLSGSIPLIAATPGNPMEKTIGLIPTSETIWTGYNLFITGTLILVLPFLTKMMMRPEGEFTPIDPKLLQDEVNFERKLGPDATPAEKLEESRFLSLFIATGCFTYLGYKFYNKGVSLDINSVNLIFFGLGLLLHKTPMAFARAVGAAVKGVGPIMIQFPLYAGIQMMMEHSGLGGMITNWMIGVANKDTFPLLAFLSSGVINFAVPSGGGHWVVQGPFVMPAAQALGADLGKAAMAIAYGEAWMNMAQPFWALPALAIAGLSVRAIMGFCVTALIVSGFIFVGGMYLF